jgi:hypothetical protein
MQAIKDFAALFGAIVGALSGIVTLYAKYRDLKSRSARKAAENYEVDPSSESEPLAPVRATVKPPRTRLMADDPDAPRLAFAAPPVVLEVADASRRPSTARARQMVQAPAITLMIVGGLSLLFNVTTVGYGFVDQFVTPLSPESAAKRENPPPGDDASTVLGMIAIASFSIASAAAIWAGYNMLRLRSYGLSLAGSVAIMPGAILCCFAGIPIGFWCVVMLLKPEVKSAFT